MPKLTVTVITRNESAHIEAALASVSWADERIVIDAESTDDTATIARRHGARVEVRPWPGYGPQKDYAASIASNDWILSLDADERVTPDLAAEIQSLLSSEPARRGYRIPRATFYLGTWIRATDWYPDSQLRLYDRRAGAWTAVRVHESVRLRSGEAGRLRSDLLHYAYRDISHHLATIDRYTTLAAAEMADSGRSPGLAAIAVDPVFAFVRNYLLRRGFALGTPGLIVSVLNSYYVFLKLAKTWARASRRAAEGASEGLRPSHANGAEAEDALRERQRNGAARVDRVMEPASPGAGVPGDEGRAGRSGAAKPSG
ncbi:MAG TPA: glycosyltransferase family 2 protein [Vicinamibacterales bacterium]